MADTRDRAVATAQDYRQGNIAGLDEAMTRRLVASVVYSESRGGDLALVHSAGFLGRYQAGPAWLAAAGYIDQNKLNAAIGEHRSEWSWAKSGGMSAFLQDSSNWLNGLSQEKYLQSADLQDAAFKKNTDAAHERALQSGLLSADDKPERIAGFLKCEHMMGYGPAAEAMRSGRAIRDAQGNTNYDFMHHITRNRDGLNEIFSESQRQRPRTDADGYLADDQMGSQAIGAIRRNDQLPSISYTSDPYHKLYKEAMEGIEKLPPGLFRNLEERQQAAASLAVEARIKGLTQIDHVVQSTTGANLIAVEGDLNKVPRDHAHVPIDQARQQTVDDSGKKLEQFLADQEMRREQTQQIAREQEVQKKMGMQQT
jgi:hypothetical protein